MKLIRTAFTVSIIMTKEVFNQPTVGVKSLFKRFVKCKSDGLKALKKYSKVRFVAINTGIRMRTKTIFPANAFIMVENLP